MNFPDGAPTWLLVLIVALWTVREVIARLMTGSESMTGMAMDWAREMRKTVQEHSDQIEILKARLEQVEEEKQALRRWAKDLFQQVKEAGGEPVPFSDYYSGGE